MSVKYIAIMMARMRPLRGYANMKLCVKHQTQYTIAKWLSPLLYNQVQAMLNGGIFSCFLRNDLWAEIAIKATLLENNLLMNSRELSFFFNIL